MVLETEGEPEKQSKSYERLAPPSIGSPNYERKVDQYMPPVEEFVFYQDTYLDRSYKPNSRLGTGRIHLPWLEADVFLCPKKMFLGEGVTISAGDHLGTYQLTNDFPQKGNVCFYRDREPESPALPKRSYGDYGMNAVDEGGTWLSEYREAASHVKEALMRYEEAIWPIVLHLNGVVGDQFIGSELDKCSEDSLRGIPEYLLKHKIPIAEAPLLAISFRIANTSDFLEYLDYYDSDGANVSPLSRSTRTTEFLDHHQVLATLPPEMRTTVLSQVWSLNFERGKQARKAG